MTRPELDQAEVFAARAALEDAERSADEMDAVLVYSVCPDRVQPTGAHKVAFEGPDPYDETRAFWFARGFHPLIELDIWETDMALLMVRPLG